MARLGPGSESVQDRAPNETASDSNRVKHWRRVTEEGYFV